MKTSNRSVSGILSIAMAIAPMAQALARDKHDDEHHDHHVSTTEAAVAGIAIGALALLAAQGQKSDAAPAQSSGRRDQTTFYAHDGRGGIVPVYMTRLGNGAFIGPRGEYYASAPSQDQLERVYGSYRPASERERQAAADDKLKVDVGQGQVRLTRGGATIAVLRTAMANVEKWKLIDDDKSIVVKSRGNHGPATVERFDTRTGVLKDKILSFAIEDGRPSWAKGMQD